MIGALIGGAFTGALLASNSSQSSPNYQQDIYQSKVVFFDAFRDLDFHLADLVGERYKGVTYLICGITGYIRNENDPEERHAAKLLVDKLKTCREWRNYISHDRSKWRSLQNPPADLAPFLKKVLSELVTKRGDTAQMLVSIGKNYLQQKDFNRNKLHR